MSTNYIEVPCRVPAGLLKEGEALRIGVPRAGEDYITWRGDVTRARSSGGFMQNDWVVIIPAFNREAAEAWPVENLPKPACRRSVWAHAMSGRYCRGQWCLTLVDPRSCQRQSSLPLRDLLGTTPFPGDWKQARYEWCECYAVIDDATGIPYKWIPLKAGQEVFTQREWRWVWRPESKEVSP